MPQQQQPEVSHKTVASPHPKYRSLIVRVDESRFQLSAGILPDEGTLYSSDSWKNFFGRNYMKNFANYVYVGQGEDYGGGGTLHFAPNISSDEANTPFRTKREFREFYWDPILKGIAFIPDPLPRSNILINDIGQGAANQRTYHAKEVYVPGGRLGSWFITEEFFSPTPFEIPFYETPVPQSVTYSVPGARGGFPNCLHERIDIPDLEAGVITKVAGNIANIGGIVQGQIFKATNITGWETRVISHTQEYRAGYYAVKISVDPPEEPDATFQ